MSVGFGFSVGDILACGKLCHQIYKACFSESGDAISSWNYLGRELYALGTALKTLSLDDNIIPSHIHEGDAERLQKEQRALEAVRMVVGDFKETLRELEAMLLKFDDFRKPAGGKQFWLKVKYTVNTGDLDKFRTRIAMHTRAVNLLLNPLIYQQMKGMQTSQHHIQTSVSNIQTRIDTIDQVLHALLFVASEQLTSATPRVSNSNRITQVGFDGDFRRSQDRYMIEPSPMNPQTIPSLLAGANSGATGRPLRSEEMGRSVSHQADVQNIQSNRIDMLPEMGVRRRITEPHENTKPLSYKPSGSRRKQDHLKHTADHDDTDAKGKGKQTYDGGSHSYYAPLSQSPPKTSHYPPPKPQRRASGDSVELYENPINAALRKQAESNEEIPIEHWITAAMHWYFKAERELEEEDGHEVSPEAYLGLMKSTWIVENVIRQWDLEAELPQEIRINVSTLIASIVEQFKKMESRKMPNIRNLKKKDYEIWHKDIKGILIEPAIPLTSPAHTNYSRETTIRYDPEEPPSRKQSVSSFQSTSSSNSHRRRDSMIPPEEEIPGSVRARDSLSTSLRLGEGMQLELNDWEQWSKSILTSRKNSATSEPSPGRDTFQEWSPAEENSYDRTSHSLYVSNGGPSDGSYKSSDPGSFYRMKRSPSASTTSTGSSGRRESLNMPQYAYSTNVSPVPIPPKKPLPPIIRKPVPAGDLGMAGLNITGYDQRSRHSSISEVDESEFMEMVGERMVLDTTPVLWAARSSGPFTKGTVKIFWHQSHEYFRLLTTYGGGRSNSQDISLRGMELIPGYAYEEEPIVFLRKSNQRIPSSNTTGTSPSNGNEVSRKGYVYKFYSSEEMLKFQTAFTGEDVYQDLVKRVSAVKLKRSTEKSGHTYHSARLQLWHEKPPSDSLLPDTASGLTGMSQATRVRLTLQWSRLVIYLGGSDCFITCFVTDDITLKRDGNKISLVPTKYSTKEVLFKSPRSVKALLIGGDHAKGGLRLDKDKISSNDEHNFDDFAYIQITFKETLYLNKFETLWNQMMDTRRRSRLRIRALQGQIESTTFAPGYDA